jgi:hypothetical protein
MMELQAEYIDQYLSVGGLPMMIRQTLTNYQGLLHMVHQQCVKHPNTPWTNSSARVMLLHHSSKLQDVRQQSGSFFEFQVATHVYLQEAAKKRFQDLALMQGVHDRLDTLRVGSQTGSDNGTAKTSNKSTACSHCKSHKLHNMLSLEHARNVCPLKDVPAKKMTACRKEILDQIHALPDATAAQVKAILATALSAVKVADGT